MGDIYLDVNGLSWHSQPRQEAHGVQYINRGDATEIVYAEPEKRYNESNNGLGLRYEWGEPSDLRKFVTGGQYENSHNRLTNYIGGGLKKRLLGDDSLYMDVGAMAGAMTGYDNGLRAALLPMVSVGGGRYGVNLMYAPEQGESPETYMLNMSYKLK